jgi:hypothetical protein
LQKAAVQSIKVLVRQIHLQKDKPMNDPIDALLEASVEHAKEIQKLHGEIAALTLLVRWLVIESGKAPDIEAEIERLKTSFLFSRLPDGQVEAAGKLLHTALETHRHP